MLAKKNNGVFPVSAVYEVIDGRKAVIAHGTRDMPIWGNRYTPDPNSALSPDALNGYIELSVRGRILVVIYYLNRIQEK